VAIVLSQEIVPHSGHVTFHNGDRLDYRKANLVTSHDRQQRLEHGAEVLRRMNRLHAPQPGSDASVTLSLTQSWTAWIDAEWKTTCGGITGTWPSEVRTSMPSASASRMDRA
jgi:hypothetical protein